MRTLLTLALGACTAASPEGQVATTLDVCYDVEARISLDEPRDELDGRSPRDLVDETNASWSQVEALLTFADADWPMPMGLGFGEPSEPTLRSSSDPEALDDDCGPPQVVTVDVVVTASGSATGTSTARLTGAAGTPTSFSVGGDLEGPLADAMIARKEAELIEEGFTPVATLAGWFVSAQGELATVGVSTRGTFTHPDFGTSTFGEVVATCAAPDPCLTIPLLEPEPTVP